MNDPIRGYNQKGEAVTSNIVKWAKEVKKKKKKKRKKNAKNKATVSWIISFRDSTAIFQTSNLQLMDVKSFAMILKPPLLLD